jgi:hypothetical protein
MSLCSNIIFEVVVVLVISVIAVGRFLFLLSLCWLFVVVGCDVVPILGMESIKFIHDDGIKLKSCVVDEYIMGSVRRVKNDTTAIPASGARLLLLVFLPDETETDEKGLLVLVFLPYETDEKVTGSVMVSCYCFFEEVRGGAWV